MITKSPIYCEQWHVMLVTLILDVDIFMLSLRENYVVVNKVYIFTNIQKKKKEKERRNNWFVTLY